MESVYLALIVAIPAMMSPLLMAWLVNRNRRQEKQEDYERQDAVADKLLAANERVAASSEITNSKLDVIHTLVNSNMTAAMQAELEARRSALQLMLEIIEFKKRDGSETLEISLTSADVARDMISKLEASLADRLKQSKEIEKIQNDKMIAGMKKEVA